MGSVARVTEVSATSETGFDDAVKQAVERAAATLRNVRSAWVKDQRVHVEDGRIVAYQANVEITFELDD